MALYYGDWRLVFVVYTIVSILFVIWLSATPIKESIKSKIPATFKYTVIMFCLHSSDTYYK